MKVSVFYSLFCVLAVGAGCAGKMGSFDGYLEPVSDPAPGATASLDSVVCSSSGSGTLTCNNGEELPLPPTFPYSEDCNECLTTVATDANGVKTAKVKCPQGLSFEFEIPKGEKGATGATGAAGSKGDKGDKGDKGATGAKGDKGDSCSVSSDGWVRCGDGSAYKLLAGPKGDKGDTGAKGDKGDTGAAGHKGDKGDKGETGDKGTTGANGVKGDKGDKGGSCSVSKNEHGQTVITCQDGTQEVMDSSCGVAGCWSFGAYGNVYSIPNTTNSMPDFSAMIPEESVVMKKFDMFSRQSNLGFPGLPHRLEWYAIRFHGYIEVPQCKSNKCQFRLTSDDGALFYLHGNLVINNDGLHAPRALTKEVKMLKGWHPFEMEWFQGPRTQIALALELSVDGGVTFNVIDHSAIKFQVPRL